MALTNDQITAQNFADFYQKILPYLNGGGMGMKLLWENSDPTQSMSAGDISLSSSDYDLLITVFKYNTSSPSIKSAITRKGDSITLDGVDNAALKHTYFRYTTAQTNTVLTFSGGFYDGNANNAICVPVAIYGIKVYNRDVPGKTTLLWSNPDPSSAFAAQNVAIGDQSGSAFIRVNVRYQSTGSNASLKGVIDIPYGNGNVSNLGVFTGSYSRQATISGNNIQFADAKSGTTTGNGYIIPESIYSIKL